MWGNTFREPQSTMCIKKRQQAAERGGEKDDVDLIIIHCQVLLL
jgi:hypothetical protein